MVATAPDHNDLFRLLAILCDFPRRYFVALNDPVADVQCHPIAFVQTGADLDKFPVVAANPHVLKLDGVVFRDQRDLRSAHSRLEVLLG